MARTEQAQPSVVGPRSTVGVSNPAAAVEVRKPAVSQEQAKSAYNTAIATVKEKGNLTGLGHREIASLFEPLLPDIRMAVQGHMNPERMIQIATTLIRSNPRLAECTYASIVGGVIQASLSRLSIAPVHGQAYLVPFGRNIGTKDKPKYVQEAQFQIGYRGWRQLALRANLIIYGECYYANDHFEVTFGSDARIIHTPSDLDNRGELMGAYAIIKFPSGDSVFKVLTKREIEELRVRNSSQKKGDGKPKDAWATDYEAMAIAKAVKKLKSFIPTDERFMEIATAVDDKVIHVTKIQKGDTNVHALPAYEEEEEGAYAETADTANVPAMTEPAYPTYGSSSSGGDQLFVGDEEKPAARPTVPKAMEE